MIDFATALKTPLDISKEITQYTLGAGQYFNEEHPRLQIFVHHTASGPNPFRCIDFWNSNPIQIGTSFVIGGEPSKDSHGNEKWKDGEIVQAFSSKAWAYHLGLKQDVFTKNGVPYKSLDRTSVAIEICNWGGLIYKDGKYFNYVGGVVNSEDVVEYEKPFRGFKFFHKYTDAQIISTIRLVKYLCEKYNIPKTYNPDIWDISKRVLSGERGIATHVSVRVDKSDNSPQRELIQGFEALAVS